MPAAHPDATLVAGAAGRMVEAAALAVDHGSEVRLLDAATVVRHVALGGATVHHHGDVGGHHHAVGDAVHHHALAVTLVPVVHGDVTAGAAPADAGVAPGAGAAAPDVGIIDAAAAIVALPFENGGEVAVIHAPATVDVPARTAAASQVPLLVTDSTATDPRMKQIIFKSASFMDSTSYCCHCYISDNTSEGYPTRN